MGGKQKQRRARLYRLNPTAEQAARLSSWVGTVRAVYNVALEQRQTFWRPGRQFNFATQGLELKELRRQFDWIADAPRNSLDQALIELDAAYANWWARRAGIPTFRRKGVNDSIQFRAGTSAVRRLSKNVGALRVQKLGELRFRWSTPPPGSVRCVTISRRAGQWFAAILYAEMRDEPHPTTLPAVGIDRGITVFAALSTGELIAGPNVGRKAAIRLGRAQRVLSRKVRGSSNFAKQRLRVARIYARVSDARKDFLHKTSTAIANNHGLVVLEDLKVRNMTASAAGTIEAPGKNVRQKAGLNRAILDQGWGMFRTMLAYKLEERGGHLLMVDPRNTSRTCSACEVVDADSRHGTRFSCRSCGHQAHADTNAAINILRRGAPLMPVEGTITPREAGTTQEISQ